jgi:hypothetical protein
MRRTLVAAPLLGVLMLAAGCGAGVDEASKPTSPRHAIFAAAEKTAATSARVFMTMEMQTGGEAMTMEAEGAFADDSGRMTMNMDVAGEEMAVEMILAPGAYFMKFPPELMQELPGAKQWVRLDFDALEDAGIDMEAFEDFQQGDPSRTLDMLRAVSDDFAKVGTESVRGVPTTRYHGTLDLEKVAELAPTERSRKAYETLIDQAKVTSFPMDVWLDADGYARRMVYAVTMSEGGDDLTMEITLELWDFGVDVDVTPPPADQVTDLAALMGAMGER